MPLDAHNALCFTFPDGLFDANKRNKRGGRLVFEIEQEIAFSATTSTHKYHVALQAKAEVAPRSWTEIRFS